MGCNVSSCLHCCGPQPAPLPLEHWHADTSQENTLARDMQLLAACLLMLCSVCCSVHRTKGYPVVHQGNSPAHSKLKPCREEPNL